MRHVSRIGFSVERRWPLTALLGSLALAGFLAALAWLPRTFQDQATVAIPRTAASATAGLAVSGGDPQRRLTPSANQIADFVSRQVMSARTIRRLAARGLIQPYAVGLDAEASSVLVVTATGSSPGRAQRMLRAVIGQIRLTVAQRVGARAGKRIRLTNLISGVRPALAASPSARPVIVIGLFGVVVALGCPVVIDARLARRRNAAGRPGGTRSARLPAGPCSPEAGSAQHDKEPLSSREGSAR